MTVAFTFPGQGSQTVGMGRKLAETCNEAAKVFEEVDEALGEKLSTLIREGPEDRLTLTENAQPALMAVSIAAMRALEVRGVELSGKAAYVAGHSLGEYSALCAAGVFSVADTARLLRTRGNAMQSAVPAGEGAMAAIIGLEQADVEAAGSWSLTFHQYTTACGMQITRVKERRSTRTTRTTGQRLKQSRTGKNGIRNCRSGLSTTCSIRTQRYPCAPGVEYGTVPTGLNG